MNSRWQAWLQTAVLRLGLSPSEFWALRVCEWRALLAALAPGGGAALDRAGLERLRAAYPDERSEP